MFCRDLKQVSVALKIIKKNKQKKKIKNKKIPM